MEKLPRRKALNNKEFGWPFTENSDKEAEFDLLASKATSILLQKI